MRIPGAQLAAITRRLGLLAFLCTLLAGCAQLGLGSSDDPDSMEVVARVEGEPVTLGELDAYIRGELFADETSNEEAAQLYKVRSKYLERLVSDRVLAAESARRGLAPEELIEQQVEALGPVTDQEAEAFYAENKARIRTPGGFETIKPQIVSFLEEDRSNKAIETLTQGADVEILLGRPRFDVAAIGPSQGPADAPVTIVEFSDFECPFCRRALRAVQETLDAYPEQVRLVYRHLPLGIHEHATPAAIAAVCADRQGQFWAYHDVLFENQQALRSGDLRKYAKELGLDVEAFNDCVQSDEAAAQVQVDVDAARALRISGTPAFFVNGISMNGARPASDFQKVIEEELGRLE